MGAKVTVLVATAEPLLTDGIVQALTATDDLEVVAKPKDRTEAIRVIRELQPGAVSVAIIDYDLYGPDVFQSIKEIKQDYESLAILALINRTTPSCLLRSLQVGVAGYLLKTATSDEIVNAVRAVYSGEAVLDLQSVYELIHHVDYSVDKQGYIGEGQRLRQRELEVLKLASKGLSNKEIALRLFLSERTVQSHFSMIFERLGVASRTKAVLEAWRNGWITNDDLVD